MRPTKITIRPIPHPKGKMVAFVEIEFDSIFVTRNWKIIHGDKGPFVRPPNRPSGKNDDKYYDDVYIVDSFKDGAPGQEFYQKLQTAILKKWDEVKSPDFTDQTTDGGSYSGDKVPF